MHRLKSQRDDESSCETAAIAIVEAIKKEGAFQQPQQNTAPKQQQHQQSQQLNLAPPLPKRSLLPEENAVNF